jgi:hypothetical protein
MPKCSPLSLFSCVSTASYRRDLQRVTWHIHPLLGNGGRCIPSSRIEEFLSGLSLIPPGECEPIEYERALSFPLRPRANEGALRGEQGSLLSFVGEGNLAQVEEQPASLCFGPPFQRIDTARHGRDKQSSHRRIKPLPLFRQPCKVSLPGLTRLDPAIHSTSQNGFEKMMTRADQSPHDSSVTRAVPARSSQVSRFFWLRVF